MRFVKWWKHYEMWKFCAIMAPILGVMVVLGIFFAGTHTPGCP